MRRYAEERELTVAIACDLSGSQFFGSSRALKKEVAAEISAVLAFSALQNNDKVGLFLFTDEVEEFVPPRKGRRHVLHLIRDLLAFEPRRPQTKLKSLLEAANRVLRRRSILFLISDFRDEGFEKALRLAALKHDLIPVLVTDPREARLPELGALLELEDPESGQRLLWKARRSEVAAHAAQEAQRLERLDGLFKLCGLDWIRISTEGSTIEPIIRFFQQRARRLRR